MSATPRTEIRFATIEEALEDIAAGKMVVVVDDEDRENEGDLVMAAQFVTARRHQLHDPPGGRLDLPRADRGALRRARPRADDGQERVAAQHAVHGHDRGPRGRHDRHQRRTTRRTRCRRRSTRPRARTTSSSPATCTRSRRASRGVLERQGHTEAAVDLARLAGLNPAGVICEIQNEDGSMARAEDLAAYCHKHGLKMITIADLIAYRRAHDHERLVERVVSATLPTAFGEFDAVGYRSTVRQQAPRGARQGRRRRRSRTCSCACTRSA